MISLQSTILGYIDEQLDAMQKHPRMWGPDLCVELQYLQLLEFRSVTLRPELERTNPRAVLEAFSEFLARRFPGSPPVPLSSLLARERREGELMIVLGEFRRVLVPQMIPEEASVQAPRRAVADRLHELPRQVLAPLAHVPGLKPASKPAAA